MCNFGTLVAYPVSLFWCARFAVTIRIVFRGAVFVVSASDDWIGAVQVSWRSDMTLFGIEIFGLNFWFFLFL